MTQLYTGCETGVADLHTDGVECTCEVAGAAEQSEPTGHSRKVRHGRRGGKRPLGGEGRSDCSTAVDAAQCGSEVADEWQAERTGTSAEHASGGSMHGGQSSWAGMPMASIDVWLGAGWW